jgi:uncharacterized membrane protein
MYVYFLGPKQVMGKGRGKDNDRIAVPELVIGDLFEDAFRPIARDGAGNIEVIRLQKHLIACMLSIILR